MDREPTGTKFADKKRWRLGNIYDEFLVSFDAAEAALLLPPLFISKSPFHFAEIDHFSWAQLARDYEEFDMSTCAPPHGQSSALVRFPLLLGFNVYRKLNHGGAMILECGWTKCDP